MTRAKGEATLSSSVVFKPDFRPLESSTKETCKKIQYPSKSYAKGFVDVSKVTNNVYRH